MSRTRGSATRVSGGLGIRTRGARGGKSSNAKEASRPSITDLVTCDIADLPRTDSIEVPITPKKKQKWQKKDNKSTDAEKPACIRRCLAEWGASLSTPDLAKKSLRPSVTDLVTCDIADLPRTDSIEVPITPKKNRKWQKKDDKSTDAENPARIRRCLVELGPSSSASNVSDLTSPTSDLVFPTTQTFDLTTLGPDLTIVNPNLTVPTLGLTGWWQGSAPDLTSQTSDLTFLDPDMTTRTLDFTIPSPDPKLALDATTLSPRRLASRRKTSVPVAHASHAHSTPSTSSNMPPSTAFPAHNSQLVVRHQDNELKELVNYGSESDDENDFEPIPVVVPRRVLNRHWNCIEEEDLEDRITSPPPDASVPANNAPLLATDAPLLPETDALLTGTTDAPTTPEFNFIWRPFDAASNQHYLRRSKFDHSNRPPGSTAHYEHPYDAFIAIWDRDIMAHIAKETNLYAQQIAAQLLSRGSMGPSSRIKFWKETTVDELYVYFSIILAMGVVVKSCAEEYWSKKDNIFQTAGFSAAMPLRRFQLLTKCLHFNNNSGMVAEELDACEAKLFKLQPLLDFLNAKFSNLYNLGQNIALDESLTQWISNKAAKVGIKTYEVCESQTGYLWRFEVHAGNLPPSPQNPDPVSGAIPSLVLRLLHGLENRGHTVWMDSYYNSPALARKLKSAGFDCAGTLRPNRQFVPTELAKMQKTHLAEGDVTGCTSGDVDILMWRDNNLVSLISTYHGNAVSVRDDVLKPVLVHDYNICMGGVDKKDQMLAMFPIERKRTRVWYKKFFRRLLNVSVLNSSILYCHSPNTRKRHTMHRQFRMDLIIRLLATHKTAQSKTVTYVVPVNKIPDEYLKHHPEIMVAANGKESIRRQCVYCHKRTHTRCAGCNVALCAFTCFVPHHKR